VEDEREICVSLLAGVHLTVAGEEVGLRGDRARALLARLALDVGAEVPRSVLIHDVWGDAGTTSGTGALRVQIKRIRDHLTPHGLDGVIERTPGGYRLAESVTVDVTEVRRAIDAAHALAETDPEGALACMTAAEVDLDSEPLRGLEDHLFALSASKRLTRMWMEALMLRARLSVETGRLGDAVEILSVLSGRAPTDEGVAITRMHALTALGSNREALAVAHQLRRDLGEVGLTPGSDVLQFEQAILNPAPPTTPHEPTDLIGRSVEIRRVGQALDALATGVGTTVTICGPAGIGKTALASAAADAALGRGLSVFSAAADEVERHHPFHILQWLTRRTGALAPEPLDLTEWLDTVPAAGQPGGFDPDSARLAVANRLQHAVAALGEPFVVVAEDLHWADESSMSLLRALSRTARQFPVLVILTGRPESAWSEALGDLPRVDISLEPLAHADAQRLAEDHVGGPLGPDLANAITSTGGNPLLVLEYLRGLELEDRLLRVGSMVDSSGSGPPTTVTKLASRRLRSLRPELIEVLHAAAVLGRTSELSLLARLCERETIADLVLADIEASGIAAHDGSRLTFEHDLLRTAVYADVPEGRRAQLHRRAARLLADDQRPVISVAAHAVLSGSERDPQAAAWMQEAAAAVCAVEPRSSIAFLDRALELAEGFDDRFVLHHAKLEALTTAGDLKEATELVDMLVQARRPETAELQVRFAGLMMAQAKANEAREILAGVDVDSMGQGLSSRWSALLGLCSYAAFDQPQARLHAGRAIELGIAADDVIGLSMAHGVVGRCSLMTHHYRDGLRSGRLSAEFADADPSGGAHLYLPWYFVGMTLLDIDDHAGVEDALGRGRAAAEHHHLHFADPLYLTLEAALAYRVGDLGRARSAAIQVLDIEQHLGSSLVSAWVRALLALVAIDSDELDLARTYCDDAEAAQAAGSPQGAHMVALARAELVRHEDDAAQALGGLREAWQFFDAFSLHACKPAIAPALARAAAHARDAGELTIVNQEMAVVTDRSDCPVHQATRLWVAGLTTADADAIDQAADMLDRAGRPGDAVICRQDRFSLRG